MTSLARQKGLAELVAVAPALFDARALNDWRRKMLPSEPTEILWWIFTACVVISLVPRFAGEITAPLSYVIAIGGSAGCGWAWLLSRTLFRSEKPIARWNLFAVAAIIAVEAWWHLTSASTGGGMAGEMRRLAGNAATFICIGAIFMVFVELFHGYGDQLSKTEKRFRQIFVSVFGAMIAASLGWASNAEEMNFGAQWVDVVIGACVFLGIVGSRLAVNFRKANPLTPAKSRRVSKAPPSAAALDKDLARRILFVMEQDNRFTTPDLKVADLAAALGEQEYKVTQSITGALGFRNFNQLVNARRIEYAREALLDPQNKNRPILSIAFDCGFNSIGPFNRAFKQETGMTPRAFRTEATSRECAVSA